MKKLLLMLLLVCFLWVPACSGSKAAGLFETAKFEEIQNNKEHAVQLYEEIVKNYPETEEAKKARERLTAIRGDKGP